VLAIRLEAVRVSFEGGAEVSTMRAQFVVAVMVLCTAAGAWAGGPGVCDGVSVVDTPLLSRVTVASGLSQPLYVTSPPGDTNRLFIVERAGRIRVLNRGGGPTSWTTYLDISAKVESASFNERGLLGLAFDPDYATNKFFYVNYTTNASTVPCAGAGLGDTIVSRFTEVGGVGDPGSEKCILGIDQPELNHNGGQLMFGPDEMLYVFTGDGGGGGDIHGTCGNGQNTATLLGKILRIAPIVPERPIAPGPADCNNFGIGLYRVPAGNPFSGAGGNCDEIWAWGLRNPWRNAFDVGTDDLYVADVGQDCYEEVNYAPAGTGASRNYGWRQMEANHCFTTGPVNCNPPASAPCATPACNDPSLTDPVIEVPQAASVCSITGGFVYRGCRMSTHQAKYFYGDYCAGFVRSMQMVGGAVTNQQDWTASVGSGLGFNLSSFGTDAQNEIYITSLGGGLVHKLVPPFQTVQVSGFGATPFRVERDVAWSWEDVFFTNMVPIQSYRVYRGVPNGTFECIHSSTTPSWTGDPTTPNPDELFAYIVTAVSGGVSSSTGEPPRVLSPNPCP
jgi:hypothetical protein